MGFEPITTQTQTRRLHGDQYDESVVEVNNEYVIHTVEEFFGVDTDNGITIDSSNHSSGITSSLLGRPGSTPLESEVGPNNVTVDGILETWVTSTYELSNVTFGTNGAHVTAKTSMTFGLPTVDNVAAIFGVSIMSINDLNDLTRRIEVGDCDDVLGGLNKDERKAVMDAIMALFKKFLADRNDKTPGVENETVNLNVDNGPYDTTTVDNLVYTSDSPSSIGFC
nr:hypothetical protein [Tanacetum cinerariifolium]